MTVTAPPKGLVDGQRYSAVPRTEDELVRELADIDAQARKQGQPLVATIYADGDADDPPLLSIGLGADESVLVYSSGRWNDEGRFSRGPRTGDTTEIAFRYGTGYSEYLGWMLIPKEPLRRRSRVLPHRPAAHHRRMGRHLTHDDRAVQHRARSPDPHTVHRRRPI